MKRPIFILLLGLLLIPTSACAPAEARLTEQKVISIVHVYGLPTFSVEVLYELPHKGLHITESEYRYHDFDGNVKIITSKASEPRIENFWPVGQWSAVYEGEQGWRIVGSVGANYGDEILYYSTTWQYHEEKLQLIKSRKN